VVYIVFADYWVEDEANPVRIVDPSFNPVICKSFGWISKVLAIADRKSSLEEF